MSEQFAIGRLVPGTKYRTRALIGSGGMGSVYEVEHVELGKLFVLKALRAQLVERTDLAARMKNEWRALGRLQHPNIVTVTDAGTTDDGVPFFVMERLDGETLATRLRREARLSVPLALRVSSGVLQALAAAHAIGVVHRDIKPQNVFLPAPGGVKLLDFGIAKLQDRDREAHVVTARGVAIGTPKYMSPEQAEGKTVDGRADIYACGLVLFEMIAGRGPFSHRRDANELVLAHMTEAPARLDTECDAPLEVADLVQRWLSKSPSDRPVDAAHAALELRHLLERYTFDGKSGGSTSALTAQADYEGSTRAEAAERPSVRPRGSDARPGVGEERVDWAEDAVRSQRTLALGTAAQVDTSVPSPRRGVDEERPHSRDARSVTDTVSFSDAATTRTVLPPPVEPERPLARVPERALKPTPGARRAATRSQTPPPVEPQRRPPEQPWLRLLAAAAGAALLSFCVAYVVRGPRGFGGASLGAPSAVEPSPPNALPPSTAAEAAPPAGWKASPSVSTPAEPWVEAAPPKELPASAAAVDVSEEGTAPSPSAAANEPRKSSGAAIATAAVPSTARVPQGSTPRAPAPKSTARAAEKPSVSAASRSKTLPGSGL